jgi:hypothetical protein
MARAGNAVGSDWYLAGLGLSVEAIMSDERQAGRGPKHDPPLDREDACRKKVAYVTMTL